MLAVPSILGLLKKNWSFLFISVSIQNQGIICRKTALLAETMFKQIYEGCNMTYVLPELPYAMDALAPSISKETLEYHYGKHHKSYVDNLNKLIQESPLKGSTLEELVMKADGGLYNNAAQIWNHTFYWNCLSPNGGGEPSGALADRINKDFGSFAAFQEQFTKACATLLVQAGLF